MDFLQMKPFKNILFNIAEKITSFSELEKQNARTQSRQKKTFQTDTIEYFVVKNISTLPQIKMFGQDTM